MCTLIKKKKKLLGYGDLKSATGSEFLPCLREESFIQQKCKPSIAAKIETGSFNVSV